MRQYGMVSRHILKIIQTKTKSLLNAGFFHFKRYNLKFSNKSSRRKFQNQFTLSLVLFIPAKTIDVYVSNIMFMIL
jgi:hypothetical protein